MKLVDTVVIVGCLNPGDKLHKRCLQHINRVVAENDMLVPLVVLIEADLVMKTRGYDLAEREVSWRALEHRIPASKIIANTVSSIRGALSLQEQGMDYFDSLISSLAIEARGMVITTDRAIEEVVETIW